MVSEHQPKVIILDGPRGAGKSTTAEILAKLLTGAGIPAVYFKKVFRSEHDEGRNMINHLDQFLASNELVVCDRFVATEWVMSTAHQRADARKLLDDCLQVENYLQHLNALHLLLLPPLAVLERRLALRGAKGRTWDMSKDAILPLWNTAHAIFRSTQVYDNSTQRDQGIIIADVLAHFSVSAAAEFTNLTRAS